MKKSKLTEFQIVSIPRQADAGVPVKDICQQTSISVPTFYDPTRRHSDIGGVSPDEFEVVQRKRR